MKILQLTQGRFALVDDTDCEFLNQWKWNARQSRNDLWYAHRIAYEKGQPRIHILMHRLLMNATPFSRVDHRDRNGLNNQRNNLRFCDNVQNLQNAKLYCTNTNGLKGVSTVSGVKSVRWRARIRLGKIETHLGTFYDPLDAARAYDAAAIQHFGEFSRTNAAMGLLPCEPAASSA